MAKIKIGRSVKVVYYTGISYTDTAVRGSLNMEDDTIYILSERDANALIGKGVVAEVTELPNIELDNPGKGVTEAPPILALSIGAHSKGAKKKEADMAAYTPKTASDLNQPNEDGEGLTITDDKIVVESDKETGNDFIFEADDL